MKGKLKKASKGWVIVWRKTKHEPEIETPIPPQAIDNQLSQDVRKKLPQKGGEIAIKFDVLKGAVQFKSIEIDTTGLANAQTASPQIAPLTLPTPFNALQQTFGKLPRDKQKIVLDCIERRCGITTTNVTMLLTAVQQDFPLGISEQKFREALLALVERPKGADRQVYLTGLRMTDDDVIQIMIHGSSVSGLRLKKKEKKGWSFDESSDYDFSIIDMKRFCWAQALGIATYGDCNTIELSDTHLHLLKLHGFCNNMRQIIPDRAVNFCVYKDLESAKRHSGYSLLCTYTKPRGFIVERLFTPEIEEKVPPDETPRQLLDFLSERSISATIEKPATNTILEQLVAKKVSPEQGNHLFNDVPATLSKLLEQIRGLPAGHDNPLGSTFVEGYCQMLEHVRQELLFISREEGDAARIHGKNKQVIQKGFDIPSNGLNDRLYGNATLYFCNCSLTIADLALRCYGSPKKVSFIVPPLEKAFTTLLDCAVDAAVADQINSNRDANYALAQLRLFRDMRQNLGGGFKSNLRMLTEHLTYARIFEVQGLQAFTALDLESIFSEFDTGHDWYLGKGFS